MVDKSRYQSALKVSVGYFAVVYYAIGWTYNSEILTPLSKQAKKKTKITHDFTQNMHGLGSDGKAIDEGILQVSRLTIIQVMDLMRLLMFYQVPLPLSRITIEGSKKKMKTCELQRPLYKSNGEAQRELGWASRPLGIEFYLVTKLPLLKPI